MTTEKTILLVDDDPNILQVAGFAVAKPGYRTVADRNGKQALELFHAEQPHLIVLDIVISELAGCPPHGCDHDRFIRQYGGQFAKK